MNFDKLAIIESDSAGLDLNVPATFKIETKSSEIFENVRNTLISNFGDSRISKELLDRFGFETTEDYLGPIYESPFFFIFWLNYDRIVILAIEQSYNENVEWLVDIITHNLKEGSPINFDELSQKRYLLLEYATAPIVDETYGWHFDLFYTFPQTHFLKNAVDPSSRGTLNFEGLSDSLSLEDELDIIEFFFSQGYAKNFSTSWLPQLITHLNKILDFDDVFPENILVVLNAIDALIQLPLTPFGVPLVANFLEKLIHEPKIAQFPSIHKVLLLQHAYFIKSPIPSDSITHPSIPSVYTSIPYIIKIIRGQIPLEKAIENWQSKGSIETTHRGFSDMMEYFGDFSMENNRLAMAESLYSSAIETLVCPTPTNFHFVHLSRKLLNAKIARFNQYATTSILHLDLHQFEKAIEFGWAAIRLALTLLQIGLKSNVAMKQDVQIIIKYLPQIKQSLLSNENEMTPVIELKIDELMDDLTHALNEGETVQILHKLEVHQESFKYLMPQTPPRFLLLTPDGRLLYAVSADYELTESESTSDSHLLAGVLTAIRTIFMEASISGSGNVKEIDAGDSTLYIEARESVVVVVSAVTMTQELKEFTNWIANIIQLDYAEVIDSWDGSSKMLKDIIEFVREGIRTKLL